MSDIIWITLAVVVILIAVVGVAMYRWKRRVESKVETPKIFQTFRKAEGLEAGDEGLPSPLGEEELDVTVITRAKMPFPPGFF